MSRILGDVFQILNGNVGLGTTFPRQLLDINNGNGIINGNLGIGTTYPQYTIDANGDINFTGILRQNGTPYISSQWSTNGTNVYYSSGNVGIYTDQPQNALHVIGDIRASSTVYASNLQISGSLNIVDTTTSNTQQMIIINNGTGPALIVKQTGVNYIAQFYHDDVEVFTIADGGLIGINTATPRAPLDIIGDTILTGNIGFGTTQPLARLYLRHFDTGTDDILRVDNINTNTTSLIVNHYGNVGIGTSTPAYPLHVIGTSYFNGPINTNNNNINAGLATITATTFSGTATQVSQNLTRGTYLTGNNYNGSVASTWAVDADSANTASKVVVRDASGNFSAGTITASLTGTATQVSQDLIRGTYLTGANYNGAGTTTWAVDADSANTASKVVVRVASGNFSAGTITASLTGTATKVSQDLIRGTYLTGTNYNGAGTTTWAVDADSANTASKVVVRDASGNFSAGTITATINGTATKVSQDLIRGTYLTGANYNGAGTTTWAVDATTTATSNKIVARDASGYLYASGVGIGTTTSLQALDVRGTIIGTSLGIGTTAPRTEVDIIGNTLHTGNIGIGTTVAKYPIHVHSSEEVFTVYNGKVGISYGTAISPSTDLEIRNSLDTNYTGILLTNDGNNYPTASLRIESKRHDQSPNIAYAGNMGLYRYNNNTSLSSNIPLGLIHFGGNHTSGSTANKAFSAYLGAITEESFSSASNMRTAIIFAPGSNAYDYYNTSLAYTNEKMRLNSYGNLGIGTTSPITTLDVRGNVLTGKGINGIYDTFIGGPYHKQYGWDTAGTLHTITYPSYCIADNSSGTLHIQVKSATGNKLGNASVSFLKANATTVDLFNVHYHKTTNLTTFTINASTNDITITTDSDCAIAWTSIGSC